MEYVKKVVGMSSEVSDSVLVGYYETFDAVEKVFPRLDPGRQTGECCKNFLFLTYIVSVSFFVSGALMGFLPPVSMGNCPIQC
jgi:hypothetical protein